MMIGFLRLWTQKFVLELRRRPQSLKESLKKYFVFKWNKEENHDKSRHYI